MTDTPTAPEEATLLQIAQEAEDYFDCEQLAVILHLSKDAITRGRDESQPPVQVAMLLLNDWVQKNTGPGCGAKLYKLIRKNKKFRRAVQDDDVRADLSASESITFSLNIPNELSPCHRTAALLFTNISRQSR